MQLLASFYIGNMQKSLSIPLDIGLPHTLSITKVRNNTFLNEKLAEGQFHIHKYLEIFYFESGEGYFQTPAIKEKLGAHDMLVVNANNPHRQFSNSPSPLVYYCLSITDLALEDIPPNAISANTHELFHLASSANLPYAKIKQIFKELKGAHDIGSFFRIQGAIFEILAFVLTKANPKYKTPPDKKDSEKSFVLNEIKKYINEHFKENITLAELEKNFFISQSQLCHYFKQQYGISPIQYLIRARIENAKLLLMNTDLSINEVSEESGFSNGNYFSYLFKKYVEQTPVQYRVSTRSTQSSLQPDK